MIPVNLATTLIALALVLGWLFAAIASGRSSSLRAVVFFAAGAGLSLLVQAVLR